MPIARKDNRLPAIVGEPIELTEILRNPSPIRAEIKIYCVDILLDFLE